MDIEILSGLLARDLRTLRREIAAYPDDESLWVKPEGVSNSGGALAQHLVGNLRHFVGHRLGGNAFARDRVAEFGRVGASREALIAEVDVCAGEVAAALGKMDPALAVQAFPDIVAGHRVGMAELLWHLAGHLAYHLGQIDYHRRVVTGENVTVDAMAVAEIPGAMPGE